MEGNTLLSYEGSARGLKSFLAKVGDYESLIILHEKAPLKNCPSIDHLSIRDYLKYRCQDAGTPLIRTGEEAQANDVHGEPMTCIGGVAFT